MFHEMGHCSLYRGHNPAVLENWMPASIMSPYIFSWYEAEYYKNNEGFYHQELLYPTTQDTYDLVKSADDAEDWIRQ